MESNHSFRSAKSLRALLILLLMVIPVQWAVAQLTLNTSRTTLGAIIKQIQSQSEYQFFYDDQLSTIPVEAIKVENASLEDVLNRILKNKNISFKVEDNIIYLKPQTPAQDQQPKVGQPRKISGTIVDENGEPLIDVNVLVKGTTNGVISDFDGNYTLMVDEENPILQFSYIGYTPQEITVKEQAVINLKMTSDTQVIDEVVVTALGIKREKKMLGYSVQEIKSDALNTTGDPSVTSALQGKVAGLQMNTSSTGLGGSTKITIRGNSSLTDNNQPLWIVDGVPFTDNQTSEASAYGGYDRGGTSFDINPEDIESISVLKGPNAAALYGSRAGNGVILVTTKKGSKKDGFGVTYNGSFTWSQVTGTLKMQDKYGQGSRGELVYKPKEGTQEVAKPTVPNDNEHQDEWNAYNEYIANRTLSGELAYGPELDGRMERTWNGELIPYSYYGNKLKDYFDTGFSQFHSVSVGSSTEKSHFRASFGFNGNDGLFKDETLEKITADINAGAEVNKYLSIDGKISLSRMSAKNRPLTGLNGEVAQLLLIPGNIRLSDLQNYTTTERLHENWFGPNQHYSNPYYVRHRYQNSDERWRAFGYYAAKLNLTDWMKFSAKYAFDYYRTRLQTSDLSLGDQAIAGNGESWQEKLTTDNMSRGEENHFEHNIEFMFTGDKAFGEKFRLGYNVGSNIMYQQFETLTVGVKNMLDKNNWLFNTAERLDNATDKGHERAMYSVFGSLQLAYNEYLSLDLTARNDWSSTLPQQNNSFFYPSASLSFVISDFVRSLDKNLPTWLTFAKLRLSAAQVGKDPEPYNLWNTRKFEFQNGTRVPIVETIKKNSNLKPEIKTSYEMGLDMKFLNNRLGFDFTYYYSSTKNQAMLVDASSPWSQQWVNAGKISNKGVEMMIYSTPVQTKDFRFDLGVNLAKNISTVDELANGVNHIYFSGDPNMPVKVGAVPGGKLGNIYANNLMKRDAQGNVVVGSDGLPIPETGNGNLEQYILDHPIGNIEPNLLMSVTPSFSYKGFTLSAMFDMKFGGDIVCVSEGMATAVGTAKRTEYRGEYKEINGVKDYYMVVPGVKEDGSLNDIPVSAQTYYSTIGLYKSAKGYAEEFVYDASYIKLKELSIGYNFPSRILKKTPFTALKLSFVGRNLCFLLKHTPGNPDGGYDTTMFSQALDYAAVPYTRTFGFSINVGF